MQLKTWELEVHCHKRLDASDIDSLDKTKHAKCNIFYRPPYRYGRYKCTFPHDTIRECNQSGLWRERNELIEWACAEYLDPFNATYENVFCYLCNVDDSPQPDKWYCPDVSPNVASRGAPNIAKFDVDTWRSALYEESVCDQMTEFKDYKMVCGARRFRAF